jgi:hypothetical protein
MIRDLRYTTPAEERRIQRIVSYIFEDSARYPGDQARITRRYTYLLRVAFNSMLRDRGAGHQHRPRENRILFKPLGEVSQEIPPKTE